MASQLLILANCVSMAMVDPLRPNSAFNQQLESIELIFTILFTVELGAMVIACGLVVEDPNEGKPVEVYFRGPGDIWRGLKAKITCQPNDEPKTVIMQPAYLLVSWNRLDAIVVAGSWLAISTSGDSVQVLRLLRLLKPLRTLKALPGLQMLIIVCFKNGENQSVVYLMASMAIFYLVAPLMLVWGGAMTGRCVADEALLGATNVTAAAQLVATNAGNGSAHHPVVELHLHMNLPAEAIMLMN